MRVTRGIVATLAMVSAMTVVPAPAAGGIGPSERAGAFVGSLEVGYLAFRFSGVDGVERRLTIDAERMEGASGTWTDLVVKIEALDGKRVASSIRYRKALAPYEFDVDPDFGGGRLETTFAGAPLSIRWSVECATLDCKPFVSTEGSGSGAKGGRWTSATGSIDFMGLTCDRRGWVYSGTILELDGSGGRDGRPDPVDGIPGLAGPGRPRCS